MISAEQLRNRLDIVQLTDALQRGHGRPVPVMERVLLHEPNTPHSFMVWHAWQPGEVIVTKMVTIFPDNTVLPGTQAVVTVFDATNGEPRAIIDGTELTLWKTVASSLLAARFLARPDSESLLVVGAGALAAPTIRGYRAAFPNLRRVRLWNRTIARAEEVATEVGGVEVVADLDEAVPTSDIVSCITRAVEPVVHGVALSPGTHLDLVGGFTPDMREADDDAVQRSTLFVDAAMFNIDHCGDLCQPLASGLITRDEIRADLFGLCRGEHPGRQKPDEITLYKSGGGAHLDLMAAQHVLELFGDEPVRRRPE
jgi:ornithine cyclodeaminase/alanine dehydrogenase-like protein (mu-crystallin family)